MASLLLLTERLRHLHRRPAEPGAARPRRPRPAAGSGAAARRAAQRRDPDRRPPRARRRAPDLPAAAYHGDLRAAARGRHRGRPRPRSPPTGASTTSSSRRAGPAEVEARLRLAIGRAVGRPRDDAATTEEIRSGDLSIDEATYQAKLGSRRLDLTFKEFELLKFLAQHPGRVFTRAQLLQEVWGYDYFGGTRTVDVHVRRLRAKLGPDREALIGTVRNVGYKFVAQPLTALPARGDADQRSPSSSRRRYRQHGIVAGR